MYKDTTITTSDPERAGLRIVLWLMALSFVVRCCLALLLELGNDEVYYWSYAVHPSLAYYDHPGMVGWLIRLFTINAELHSALAVRLPALVLGTLNIWLMYSAGRKLGTVRTAVASAGLFAASTYGAVISGTIVLPDTPLVFFWLVSINLMLSLIQPRSSEPRMSQVFKISQDGWLLVWVGLSIGLAMASKYQAAFLAVGTFAFVALYRRSWFKKPYIYGAFFVALLCTLPMVFWHASNGFESFVSTGSISMQGRTLVPSDLHVNLNTLLQEIVGQIGYQNPIVWGLVVMGLVRSLRHPTADCYRYLLLISVPLVVLFIVVSAFRSTLPHWGAAGYVGLMLIASNTLYGNGLKPMLPVGIRLSLCVMLAVSILAMTIVRTGWLLPAPAATERLEEYGRNDVFQDVFGWEQVAERFAVVRAETIRSGLMPEHAPITGTRWFTLARCEYFLAYPLQLRVVPLGPLRDVHMYWFYNKQQSPLLPNKVWFVSTSRVYTPPERFTEWYGQARHIDTSAIVRGHDTVGYMFIGIAENRKPE